MWVTTFVFQFIVVIYSYSNYNLINFHYILRPYFTNLLALDDMILHKIAINVFVALDHFCLYSCVNFIAPLKSFI